MVGAGARVHAEVLWGRVVLMEEAVGLGDGRRGADISEVHITEEAAARGGF
jgi:hypothetical protein